MEIQNTDKMLCENVILADASYIDKTAGDFSRHFGQILQRTLPKADLAHWLDCIALDGGIQPGDNEIQVILIHGKDSRGLDSYVPSDFKEDIHSKAFKDNIGEFTMYAYPVEKDLTSTEFFFLDTLTVLLDSEKTRNIMVLPDVEAYGEAVQGQLAKAKDKNITLFAMTPQEGEGFNTQILGYSLMSALGISADEL